MRTLFDLALLIYPNRLQKLCDLAWHVETENEISGEKHGVYMFKYPYLMYIASSVRFGISTAPHNS